VRCGAVVMVVDLYEVLWFVDRASFLLVSKAQVLRTVLTKIVSRIVEGEIQGENPRGLGRNG
jgi:hypothetical protein